MNMPVMNTPASAEEAIAIQNELRKRVVTEDQFGEVRLVSGVDVGYDPKSETSYAAVAVLTFPGLEPADQAWARVPTEFPYVPGLLSFREIPAILAALAELPRLPDLFLCDGQGIAHPRRIGIASHLGVLLDMPTIGVAKSRLVGSHAEPGPERGDWAELRHRGQLIGAVLRTRRNTLPLYISPGHRVSLETSIRYTLACAPKYRLPETTRRAHNLAAAAKTASPGANIGLAVGGKKGYGPE